MVRQKDCLENIPRAAREEEKRMLTESAAREIESLKSSLLHKSQEFAAAKAKSAELENKVNDLSEGIKSQQRMIQSAIEVIPWPENTHPTTIWHSRLSKFVVIFGSNGAISPWFAKAALTSNSLNN